MRPSLYKLWQDERGSLLVTQWAFVVTILMLSILTAAVAARSRLSGSPDEERRGTLRTGANVVSAPSTCGSLTAD